MADILIANGESYVLEDALKICLGFCLFDGSYPKYDEPYDKPVDQLSVPYGEIRARTPINGKIIQTELDKRKSLVKEVKQELDNYNQDLDKLTEEEWHHCRDKLVILVREIDSVKGISDSVSTKILHRHFRNLLPVVDNECVRQFHKYKGSIQDVFDQIRQDMIASKDTIDKIQNFLAERITSKLTRLRIFDILLFALMRAKNNKVKVLLQ